MPNPDLDHRLTHAVTRRRLTRQVVAGQTQHVHADLPDIRCYADPTSPERTRDGSGTAPTGEWEVTVDPDSDVRGPIPAEGTRDVLLVTGGPYAGTVLDVVFVRHHEIITRRAARCLALDQLPVSTAAP